jgi:restriction system protein
MSSTFRRLMRMGVFNSHPPAKQTLESAPPFSFGAIVRFEIAIPDGQIITLIDPVYRYLVGEIEKNPEIIYQIDSRKMEEVVAAAYAKAGFDEVILTPRSGDFGRDVIAIKKGFYSIKFIDQVKAYKEGHIVKADEVRALLGVLSGEQDASKAIFTTTSTFAPKIEEDKFIKPFLPYRLELVNKEKLITRLLQPGGNG